MERAWIGLWWGEHEPAAVEALKLNALLPELAYYGQFPAGILQFQPPSRLIYVEGVMEDGQVEHRVVFADGTRCLLRLSRETGAGTLLCNRPVWRDEAGVWQCGESTPLSEAPAHEPPPRNNQEGHPPHPPRFRIRFRRPRW